MLLEKTKSLKPSNGVEMIVFDENQFAQKKPFTWHTTTDASNPDHNDIPFFVPGKYMCGQSTTKLGPCDWIVRDGLSSPYILNEKASVELAEKALDTLSAKL